MKGGDLNKFTKQDFIDEAKEMSSCHKLKI